MEKNRFLIGLIVIFFAICILIPASDVKAAEEKIPIKDIQTTYIDLDEEVTLTISGKGIVWENISKTRYVSSYPTDVGKNNIRFSSDNGVLYNKDKTELICYPSEKQGKTFIADESVKTIKEYAFSNNYYLEEVDISKVDVIERGTFYSIKTLKNVKLPETLTQMGTAVFSGASSLKEVTLPKGITKIEACTFTDANELKKVNFPNTIAEIGDYAFAGCSYLEKFTVPLGTTKLGNQVFQACHKMEKLYIPNTVKQIESLGEGLKTTQIYCKSGTYAEEYLKNNEYECQIDDTAPVMIITYSELEKTK